MMNNNKYVAAILMDLSKAFDCLPHDLLLLKLKYLSYAFNRNMKIILIQYRPSDLWWARVIVP